MDVGLVCDRCDAFNAMQAASCVVCGSGLSLGATRRAASRSPGPASPAPVPAIEQTQSKGSAGTSRVCKECGNPVQPGYRFCGSCGAPFGAARDGKAAGAQGERGRTQYFSALQQSRAKLVLIKGDGLDGVSFTLAGQDHIAGRTEGPLLFQDDPFLSPRHANFYYKDGKLHVRDEVSANGIYVRIRQPAPMANGDTFLVGEQILRAESTSPETAGLGPDEEGTYVFASPRRASRMRLVQLLRGGDVGLCVRASGEVITLGRDGNDVNFPDDPFISGRHAQVSFSGSQNQGMLLTDLGSKNGTFIRIRQDMLLGHGDYVFMGQQLLRVEIVA
jgi:pSer/pThr/pTyr-binding forkhead associated (FHA) protein